MKSSPPTFRYEEELRRSFTSNMAKVPSGISGNFGRVVSVEESNCSEGRADLVYAHVNSNWMETLKAEEALLYQQATCSKIISALKPTAVRSEFYLFSKIGISLSTLRKWLSKLEESNIIKDVGGRRYKLSQNFYLPEVEISSYEFKLSNWRRALFQAIRYRTFSHRVFVVMPAESINLAVENLDIFQKFNIGIMSHDAMGNTKKILNSKKRSPSSKYRFLMALGMLRTRSSDL